MLPIRVCVMVILTFCRDTKIEFDLNEVSTDLELEMCSVSAEFCSSFFMRFFPVPKMKSNIAFSMWDAIKFQFLLFLFWPSRRQKSNELMWEMRGHFSVSNLFILFHSCNFCRKKAISINHFDYSIFKCTNFSSSFSKPQENISRLQQVLTSNSQQPTHAHSHRWDRRRKQKKREKKNILNCKNRLSQYDHTTIAATTDGMCVCSGDSITQLFRSSSSSSSSIASFC